MTAVKSTTRRRNHRNALFRRQHGLCFYCHQPMRQTWEPKKGQQVPRDLCTIEHRHDRFDESRHFRYNTIVGRRHVAACWGCNNDRARLKQNTMPLEELRARSGAYPSECADELAAEQKGAE